jgi:hypothetical protein
MQQNMIERFGPQSSRFNKHLQIFNHMILSSKISKTSRANAVFKIHISNRSNFMNIKTHNQNTDLPADTSSIALIDRSALRRTSSSTTTSGDKVKSDL